MEIPKRILRWSNRAEVAVARRTGWSLATRALGVDVAVLDTVGAKTGRPRSSIVAYFEGADGQILVSGGAGGRSQVPDWVVNLRAEPTVRVTINRRSFIAIAREPSGDERGRAVAIAFDEWPFAATYEQRSGRPIPVFLLTRQRQKPTR